MIGYERHSPSALNLFAASPSMFVLERILGLKQPVGVPAHRGVAVEDGVAHGLKYPDVSLKECTEIAYTKYATLAAMSPDNRREKYRADIPDMVSQALDEAAPVWRAVRDARLCRVEAGRPEVPDRRLLRFQVGSARHHYGLEDHRAHAVRNQDPARPASRAVRIVRQQGCAADLRFSEKMSNVSFGKRPREHREALYQIARKSQKISSRFPTIPISF